MYRYWVETSSLLLQVNIENKDILSIYTSNQGQKRFECLIFFIPATNFDDTKSIFDIQATNLVMICMVNIFHKWELCVMLPMTEMRNNNFGKSYCDSNYFNHVTSLFDIQDPILEIV
jgi:hypothetical protein